ncbi:MAG: M48 family metalloprotease [Lysobacteraceae bacterium]
MHPAFAQVESSLPDIGSSAAEAITPTQQDEYGAYTLHELRRLGYVLDDALVDDWLQSVGNRLVANSPRPSLHFTFFLMRSRDINAFATLGGYSGINVGLILAAQDEDEMAAVMAHEISHVTQNHILRAVERTKKAALPIILGMLGAIVLAQKAGGNSGANATQAAIATGQSLLQQTQIDFTRANEAEADRIGIQTLARADYQPIAMADFFARLQLATRSDRGSDSRYQAPDFLQTHPVTTTRISEATERARQLERDPPPTHFDSNLAPANPLLPQFVSTSALTSHADARGTSRQFDWAKERLRVLSADSPGAALSEYRKIQSLHADKFNDAQRYGTALAQLRNGETGVARLGLQSMLDKHPDNVWVDLALADAERASGNLAVARSRYDAILARTPNNRGVILSYAQALGEIGTAQAGRRAQEILKPLQDNSREDAVFQQTFARASELAGDSFRAGEAYAEAAFLNGRAEDALNQLERLKKSDRIDYYQRSRIDARIAEMTPIVLELQKYGVHAQDADRERQLAPQGTAF